MEGESHNKLKHYRSNFWHMLIFASPFFSEDSDNSSGSSPVLDHPRLRLRTLDPALGNIKWNINTAAQSSSCQTQHHLPAELQSRVLVAWEPVLHGVIETKVDHVEEPVPAHGGGDTLA